MLNRKLEAYLEGVERTLPLGAVAGETWTADQAFRCGLRTDTHCPRCGKGTTEDEDHPFLQCSAWEVVRGPLALLLVELAGEIPWQSEDTAEWPPCLRLCCLPPTRMSGGVTADVTSKFVETLLKMFCRVLQMRMGRERLQECLFNRPGGTQRAFPFGAVWPQTESECGGCVRHQRGCQARVEMGDGVPGGPAELAEGAAVGA